MLEGHEERNCDLANVGCSLPPPLVLVVNKFFRHHEADVMLYYCFLLVPHGGIGLITDGRCNFQAS